MPTWLDTVRVKNYRCLKQVDVKMSPINVLFGPNGVGKSSFLDAIRFVHECADLGTDMASSNRNHGLGTLWDGANPNARIEITLQTKQAEYTVSFGFSDGRIEPRAGEHLRSLTSDKTLIRREAGSSTANFYDEDSGQEMSVKLREPNKLAFANYLLLCKPTKETEEIDEVLRSVLQYDSRAIDFHPLRRMGSERTEHTVASDRWQNLWSVLANLLGLQAEEQQRWGWSRYGTIIEFMRKGFPGSFHDLKITPIGGNLVSVNFLETDRDQPILASGISDGHLQLLGLLVSLFGDFPGRRQVLIFDEPDLSLHPHAISVFAKAVERAQTGFNRQVFMATHSPVLLSQFSTDSCLVLEPGDKRETLVTPLSAKEDLRELLEEYALGSLYMAETVANQSRCGNTGSIPQAGE